MRLSCCCYPLCGRSPTMGYVTPYMKKILPATKYFLKNSTEKMDTLFGLILFVWVIFFQSIKKCGCYTQIEHQRLINIFNTNKNVNIWEFSSRPSEVDGLILSYLWRAQCSLHNGVVLYVYMINYNKITSCRNYSSVTKRSVCTSGFSKQLCFTGVYQYYVDCKFILIIHE